MTEIRALVILLAIISNLLYASEPDATLIMAQDLPMLVSSQDLKDAPEASSTFGELVYIYKQNRQKRREEQQSAIFLQEDLDVFNNFISENNHTESALTAKLLIANLLFGDANIVDLQLPKTIYKEIANKYSDTWQGKIASYNLMCIEIYVHDPNFEKHKNMLVRREESINLLELAQFLDYSTKTDVRAYCSFDSFPQLYCHLELIATFSERLGEYEMAKEYYEKIMHRYPNTKMSMRVKHLLEQVQAKLDVEDNKHSTNIPASQGAFNGDIVSNNNKDTVVTNIQEQDEPDEQEIFPGIDNATQQPWWGSTKHITMVVAAVISFILFVGVSLLFWGIGMSRKH